MGLENQWAVEAYVRAIAYKFKQTHAASYTRLDAGLHVVDYGNSQVECFAVAADPPHAIQSMQAYAGQHVIDVFHDSPMPSEWLLNTYTTLGYERIMTSTLLGVRLPRTIDVDVARVEVREVTTKTQVDLVNQTHQQYCPMPTNVVGDVHLRQFYAGMDAAAVGWTQSIMEMPGLAYVAEMFVMPAFRRKGIAAALLNKVHVEAALLNKNWALLVPSQVTRDYYPRFGYAPLSYFSVFEPHR